MDDIRLDSLGHADWYTGRTKDDAKKRSRHQHAEPQEDPIDEVILSSAGDQAPSEGEPE